jgi:hypothetical protein
MDMVSTGVAQTSLHIYVRNQRVAHFDNPAPHSILDWLGRLDGEYVTRLVLSNGRGWLTIDTSDEVLSLCICNNNLEILSCEMFSREDAPDVVLQFIDDKFL